MKLKKEVQSNKISTLMLLLFTMIFFTGCKEAITEKPPAVKVVLAKPVYMLFQEKLGVQGNVKPEDHADICARIDGTLNVLLVAEGDYVKKGQLLFQTDKINLENQIEISAQSIKVAETAVKRAEVDVQRSIIKLKKDHLDYERAVTLKKVLSKTAYEKIELTWKDSEA